ncbi:DNA polymerase [Gillisia sp. JM1]|uniref:DNA polymerase n=1 Tax=Gillisia sp. JM1 TaxID=1283286 RepID=UPI00041D5F10|nr:DNA polymerase [Gillisia sp. JM1]
MKKLCFDLETTGLDVHTCRILGIAFCCMPLKAFYVSFSEDEQKTKKYLERLRPIFEDDSITKIGHNLKFDMNVLRSYGIKVKGPLIDTMVMDYLIHPDDKKHGLKKLSLQHLNYQQLTFNDVAMNSNRNEKTLEGVHSKIVTNYACEDADQTFQLYNHFNPLIGKYKLDTVYKLDCQLVSVLADMEYNGVLIDKKELKKIEKDVELKIGDAKLRIEQFTKGTVLISSPPQISMFLFEELALTPMGERGENGHYSVSQNVLHKLVGEHQIIGALLDYRGSSKVKTTFIKALKNINPKTGRLHTSYNQTVAATGRLSSSKPNLQNIPSQTIGKQLRACFKTPKGYSLIGADYSNIELRVTAHLSQDKKMLNAYRTDVDLHTLTTSKIFNIPYEEVTKEKRGVGKTVNFGLLYGMSAFGLSEKLSREGTGYTIEECTQFINDFFELYEGVKKFSDDLIYRATTKGYAETMIGRRRPLPELQSNDTSEREAGKRKALNTPIQGTAADILKIAMVSIYNRLKKEGLKSKMLLQVHDELLFEVPDGEKNIMKKLIRLEMVNAVHLSIPLEVDLKIGKSWKEAH